MFEISCPSCGNPVQFRRESSVYSTCDACGSILLRKNANIELLGKAADLQPDNTPLQVGTRGQYKGQGFEILGRIQIRQEEGFWNEENIGCIMHIDAALRCVRDASSRGGGTAGGAGRGGCRF